MKQVLLTVSFGTSQPATLNRVEAALQRAMPHRFFYRAWMSERLRTRENIESPMDVLHRLDPDTDLLVVTTFLYPGREWEKLREQVFQSGLTNVRLVPPLFAWESELAQILNTRYRNEKCPVILMGHGSDYRIFNQKLCPHIRVAALNGEPSLEAVLAEFQPQAIVFAPLLMTAGYHARYDLAKRWKTIAEDAGCSVTCDLQGLGEWEAVRDLLVRHAKEYDHAEISDFY